MSQKCLLLRLDTVEYGEAWELQKSLLDARVSGKMEDCFVLLQHPATFTYGRRYKEGNLIANKEYYEHLGFSVYNTDRGGLATYHGPGQIVGYPIIRLSSYTKDFYQYLRMLEEVMIRMLSDFGIVAGRKEGYTGVWTNSAKIGFIGIRMVFGYTMHGFSINVNNDVSPFYLITPCGIEGVKITSVQEQLNASANIHDVCNNLVKHYSDVFQTKMMPVETKSIHRNMCIDVQAFQICA